MATLAELETRQAEQYAAVEDIYAKSDEDGGKLSDEDRRRLDDYAKNLEDLDRQVKDAHARGQNAERLERLNGKPTSMIRFPDGRGEAQAYARKSERSSDILQVKSIGEYVANHDDYQHWFKDMAPSGQLPQRARIQSPPIETKELLEWVVKGLLTSVGMRPVIQPDWYGLQAYPGWPPLPIFGVITNATTNTDTIEFARITGYDNQAAPVPEANTIDPVEPPPQTGTAPEYGVKPMSNMTVAPDSTTVKTIAHWIPATKRVLADVAQLQSLIDAFLREGLRQQLAYQIINGTGTGENFRGILATPGLLGPVAAGTDPLGAIRRARTLAAVRGRAVPNAILMNPVNWEAIDLLTYQTGQYIFGGPMSMGTPRLWGLPVIEDEAMPVGTALVGDFRTCVLWNRQQATISATDSHADFFIRNLVAILGELRAAFALMQPSAIVRVTGLPGTALPAGAEVQSAGPSSAPVSSSSTSGGGTTPRSASK